MQGAISASPTDGAREPGEGHCRARGIAASAVRWTGAWSIWLGLGFSLGWYYTFTYYGRTGWPMPMVEPCAAIILYYFSVLNVAAEGQAAHWLVVFPVAGTLWAWSLWITARWMNLPRPRFAETLTQIAWTCWPLVAPGPAMAYWAGRTNTGFEWARMVQVALNRTRLPSWPWLTSLYVGLGVCALVCQMGACRRMFPGPWKKSVVHYVVSAIVAVMLACAVGALAGACLYRWQV